MGETGGGPGRQGGGVAVEAQVDGPALIGRTLGEFVIREPLSSGGFGRVYRAEQPALGREAVIKVLHDRLQGSQTIVQRFLREARLASRLDHPYAAHTYAFGAEPNGLLWIAMELVRGTPLDRLLERQGPIPLERFVPLLDRISEVVHTAHEQGIIHRDLKPGNVMVLSRAGRLLPKLLDFGIAKLDTAGDAEAPRPGSAPPVVRADRADGSLDETLPPSAHDPTFPGGEESPPDTTGRLTQIGSVMGSPLYMAPEQWSDAARADARSDLYALAVLSYEVLTGKPPFRGDNPASIAAAHLRQPVPSLGPGFPRKLDAVLARAMAKDPAERYASALEFAAALRAASGVSGEPGLLPRLDDRTRTWALAHSPQPLAHAVAELDGARNAHQARDALWQVVRVVVRLVGVSALAAHSHIHADGAGTDPVLGDALRRLRDRAVSSAAWIELARELVRGFVDLRAAHPLPELVDFLLGPDSQPLDDLLRLRAADDLEPGAGGEEPVRDLLETGLGVLGRLLDRLHFVGEYSLVVPVADGAAEEWMGIRRERRLRRRIAAVDLAAGRPALLDADGVPVLSLWPFVQVLEPSPGAAATLFFLEGRGRRGARLVALPSTFEQEDELLWESLGGLLGDGAATAEVTGEEASPFPGLAPFTEAQAGSFFGRERETDAFVNRLRVSPMLAVVGPSGAGKSSFVQAGVVPALPPGWRAVIVRPGSAPLVSLAARLAALGLSAGPLRAEMERDPGALGSELRAYASARGITLVVVVDQLEELFTLCDDDAERSRYAEALVGAARSAEDPVRIIFTLRDDFLLRAEALPPLQSRLAPALELLTTPSPQILRRILAEPIRRAGYQFDDPALPDLMIESVAGAPGALALLSFTAGKLWELRDRRFRQISHKAYRSLGGIGGALAQHAEATLKNMAPEERRLVRVVFRHLVTAAGTRAALTRAELDQVLGGNSAAAASAIEKLVAARLLVVVAEGEGPGERIEIIHEALLEAWPRMVSWRREDLEGARLRDQLRGAARQWDERGQPSGLLWRGDALAEYRLWQSRHPGALTAAEEAFAAASLAEAARGRRRIRIAVAAGFAALSIAVALLLWMNSRAVDQRSQADRQRSVAEERLVRLQVESGRQALLARDYPRAAAYLAHAYQHGFDDPATRFMLAQAVRPLRLRPIVLHHGERLAWVAFSPDGGRVVTSGYSSTAVVWSTAGERLFAMDLGGEVIQSAEFSPDGRVILGVGAGGNMALWDAGSGRTLASRRGHASTIWGAAFSPDGTRFATAGGDQLAVVWSTATGEPLVTLRGHRASVIDVAWAPDGRRLATASADGTARLWDPDRGAEVATLVGTAGGLARAVAFSPDGRLLAVAADRTIHVWRVGDQSKVALLSGHAATVNHLAFMPDGRLVSGSWDGTAKVWEVADSRLLASLEGHRAPIWSVRLAADGSRILTTGEDGAGRLWDPGGLLLATLSGHSSSVEGGALDPRGRLAATAGNDGTARLWPLDVDSPVGLITGHRGLVVQARFSQDSRRIVTTSRDRTVRVWDRRTGAELARFATESPTAVVAFAGPGLAIATGDGRRLVLRSPEGKPTATIELPFEIESVEVASGFERMLALSIDGRLMLVDVGSRRAVPLAAGTTVTSARFGADGRRIALARVDGQLEIWDATSGQRVVRIAGAPGIAATTAQFCAGDSRLMSAAEDGSVTLWDAGSGDRLRSVVLKPGTRSPVVTPDCAFLAAAGDGRPAVMIDAADGRPLDYIDATSGEAHSPSVSPDGRTVAVPDGMRVWTWEFGKDLDPAELVRLARCELPYRVEGAGLVQAGGPQPGCRNGS